MHVKQNSFVYEAKFLAGIAEGGASVLDLPGVHGGSGFSLGGNCPN